MRREKKRAKGGKRLALLFISGALIAGGLWFSTTNVYKFAKGYLMFKVEKSQREEFKPASAYEKKEDSKPKEKELYAVRPKKGEDMGELYIPKLNATLPIYHGTDEDELEKGVGHYANSVLPGEEDNSVLSGHRDTVFRKLGEIGKRDVLTVRTSAGEFTYKVKRVRIVDADDRTVIVPKPKATLTVTTCYPFNFIGDAPQRYILEAFLVDQKLNP
ncbi:class D sortase [Fictibacillus aquaticus]|uniref:Class D sortase n=1 Tax=Fictibacillus aquaticus TaxID=2021314 RepID=A0A235F8Y4_9BACL|nr:class D sortase [Fictibacillus aquaticus]OYD57738.1 class D sortase [Fictibacillus aquaticus]